MRLVSLASSSKGNCYYLQGSGGQALLIDDGLSYRELVRRAAAKAVELERVKAVLITHSHNDHVQGLKGLLKHRPLTVYANYMTAETIIGQEELEAERFVTFENGQEFEIEGLAVTPFSIPHDTSDPVGYLVRDGAAGECYFHGTDIGTPLDSIGRMLSRATLATLESNHDPVMLRTSGRHASLIERIAGRRGHLSNDEAAALVERYAADGLKKLFLAHLSQDCNAPSLAERAMRAALQRRQLTQVELEVLEP